MTDPEARVLPGSWHHSGAELSTKGPGETPFAESRHLQSILSSSSFLCLMHGSSTGTLMLPKEGSLCVGGCVGVWGAVKAKAEEAKIN